MEELKQRYDALVQRRWDSWTITVRLLERVEEDGQMLGWKARVQAKRKDGGEGVDFVNYHWERRSMRRRRGERGCRGAWSGRQLCLTRIFENKRRRMCHDPGRDRLGSTDQPCPANHYKNPQVAVGPVRLDPGLRDPDRSWRLGPVRRPVRKDPGPLDPVSGPGSSGLELSVDSYYRAHDGVRNPSGSLRKYSLY
jgi:hypothetical protein